MRSGTNPHPVRHVYGHIRTPQRSEARRGDPRPIRGFVREDPEIVSLMLSDTAFIEACRTGRAYAAN